MNKRIILVEGLILLTPIIAWSMGVISFSRLGDIMIAFGVMGLAFVVPSVLNFRVPLGDISRLLTLSEIGALERPREKRSVAFALQLFLLVVFPLTLGILIQLFS
jgi:hypothetical protein